MSFYKRYHWDSCVPVGIHSVEKDAPLCYRILKDPYNKRFTIERYRCGHFEKLLYDSLLLDFRSLSERNQVAWSQEVVTPTLIAVRDIDDRLLYLEKNHLNEKGFPRCCEIFSPTGVHLATNWIGKESATLVDSEGVFVGQKKYAVDENGVFGKLLSSEGFITS